MLASLQKTSHIHFAGGLFRDPKILGSADLAFTAVLSLEPVDGGTRYTALALHRDESDRQRHEDIGFHDGWGKALDQLVEHARGKR